MTHCTDVSSIVSCIGVIDKDMSVKCTKWEIGDDRFSVFVAAYVVAMHQDCRGTLNRYILEQTSVHRPKHQ